MMNLSANKHDLSANMTNIFCKCRIKLKFLTPAFRGFCQPAVGVGLWVGVQKVIRRRRRKERF